jgi:hypothetical protein
MGEFFDFLRYMVALAVVGGLAVWLSQMGNTR